MPAREQIDVAVAIEVGKGGRGDRAEVEAVERARGAGELDEVRRRGRSRVLPDAEDSRVVARDEVEVAVGVEVDESGSRAEVRAEACEGIRGAGARGEGRRGGGARVLEVEEAAEVLSRDQVEVAVAIEVAERRRGVDADVETGEGIRA